MRPTRTLEPTRSRNPTSGWRLLPCLVAALFVAGPASQAALAAPPSVVAGERSIDIRVSVIHATRAASPAPSVPSIRHLEGQLSRSFRDYNVFTPVSTRDLVVGPDGSSPLALPNGTSLVLRHDGTQDGYIQLHLSVGGLRTTVQVKPGAVFFQAGRAYDGGILVLAFEVGR